MPTLLVHDDDHGKRSRPTLSQSFAMTLTCRARTHIAVCPPWHLGRNLTSPFLPLELGTMRTVAKPSCVPARNGLVFCG